MRIPLLLAVGIAATFVTPPSVSAQLGKIPWVREDFTVTQAALPLAAPAGNPRLIVEHAQGTLRIVVMSSDEGITWDTDNVIVLRNDGAGYDLGYPRSTLLPDGTIVTVYYFVTDGDPITHIACTRWRPPAKAP